MALRVRRSRACCVVTFGTILFFLSQHFWGLAPDSRSEDVRGHQRAQRSAFPLSRELASFDRKRVISKILKERYGDESQTDEGVLHQVISIDETGTQRYYARRDLEAWLIALQRYNFTVSERFGPFRPAYFRSQSSNAVSMLLCMAMSKIDRKCITPDGLLALPSTIRVNQLHGFRNILWRKDAFCTTMENATARARPDVSASFRRHLFPCWSLPSDGARLQRYMSRHPDVVYAVKPSSRGEGRGIYLATNYETIRTEMTKPRQMRLYCVASMRILHGPNRAVQRLLDDPFLLLGHKFDLRCYVLVTSMQPLRLYRWKDGLVRLASHPYQPITAASVANASAVDETSWMTNTFVNKKTGASIHNLTWSFARLSRHLQRAGLNPDQLWANVNEAISDTFILAEGRIIEHIRSVLKGKTCPQCFQLLGVDVILDQNLEASVIEVNGLPSMQLSQEFGDVVDRERWYTAMKLEMLDVTVAMLTWCPDTAREEMEEMLTDPEYTTSALSYAVTLLCEDHQHRRGYIRLFPSVGTHANASTYQNVFMEQFASSQASASGEEVLTNYETISQIRDVIRTLDSVGNA